MATSPIWLVDFGSLLQTWSLGVEGTDLFLGDLPDSVAAPASVLGVIPYNGLPASRNLDGPVRSYPRASMLFRGDVDDYLTPANRANAVYEFLLTQYGIVIGSNHYDMFLPLQEPGNIGGKDDTNRYVIGFNIEAHRKL